MDRRRRVLTLGMLPYILCVALMQVVLVVYRVSTETHGIPVLFGLLRLHSFSLYKALQLADQTGMR